MFYQGQYRSLLARESRQAPEDGFRIPRGRNELGPTWPGGDRVRQRYPNAGNNCRVAHVMDKRVSAKLLTRCRSARSGDKRRIVEGCPADSTLGGNGSPDIPNSGQKCARKSEARRLLSQNVLFFFEMDGNGGQSCAGDLAHANGEGVEPSRYPRKDSSHRVAALF